MASSVRIAMVHLICCGAQSWSICCASTENIADKHFPLSKQLSVYSTLGKESRVVCRHETLAVGERCPIYGRGRLFRLPAGVEIRLLARAAQCTGMYKC